MKKSILILLAIGIAGMTIWAQGFAITSTINCPKFQTYEGAKCSLVNTQPTGVSLTCPNKTLSIPICTYNCPGSTEVQFICSLANATKCAGKKVCEQIIQPSA